MPQIMVPFSAQIGADNTDVFSGNVNAQIPSWFNPSYLRLQILFSDSDHLHSFKAGQIQLSESVGPHVTGADNIQAPDWTKPHYLIPVPRGLTDFPLLLDVNAVTAGFGLAIGQWEK